MPQEKCCKACGEPLGWNRRWNTKFCNANCRKRFSRQRQQVIQLGKDLLAVMDSLALNLQKEDFRQIAYEAMSRIRDRAEEHLEAVLREDDRRISQGGEPMEWQ